MYTTLVHRQYLDAMQRNKLRRQPKAPSKLELFEQKQRAHLELAKRDLEVAQRLREHQSREKEARAVKRRYCVILF